MSSCGITYFMKSKRHRIPDNSGEVVCRPRPMKMTTSFMSNTTQMTTNTITSVEGRGKCERLSVFELMHSNKNEMNC